MLSAAPKHKRSKINHVCFVLDGSWSMGPHARTLVEVADNLIQHLADQSVAMEQETRVTVYIFDDNVECVIYDKDVLRMPSIAQEYKPNGNTALLDATIQALDDLRDVSEKYGDHAFLIYVLTDGQENRSTNPRRFEIASIIEGQPDNRTIGIMVPDQNGVFMAKRYGFPASNIAIWDATTARGVQEAGATLRASTQTFMQDRAAGKRSSTAIFSTAPDAVNKKTVSKLTPLRGDQYDLTHITRTCPIKEWVENDMGQRYKVGTAYFQLTKTETIQPDKKIAILEEKTGKVYVGEQARQILGLPDMKVSVKPDYNKDYRVFVQSKSVNRKLIEHTKLLVIP